MHDTDCARGIGDPPVDEPFLGNLESLPSFTKKVYDRNLDVFEVEFIRFVRTDGYFAAWEQPELVVHDFREGLGSLRSAGTKSNPERDAGRRSVSLLPCPKTSRADQASAGHGRWQTFRRSPE